MRNDCVNAGQPAAESVRSRYIVTLGAQVFRMFLSAISAAIVPRALGPAAYGDYSFLLSTSTAIRGFLDNGTQQAFFTFSSQEPTSGPLTKLYSAVLGLQLMAAFAFAGVAIALGRTDWLWRAQQPDRILLVMAFDWALFAAVSLQQLGDSKGQTVRLQLIGAGVAVLTLCGLLALYFTGSLTFHTFVGLNLTGAIATCVAFSWRLIVRNRAQFWSGAVDVARYARRWWDFTRPLILLQYYLPVTAYLGSYLLQRWYGSQEQGYYALALQWSSFAMVFTTSGLWIFWREIARHSAARDQQQAARTYVQFSRMFFFLALVLSCGLSAASSPLVDVVAGERFRPAGVVLAIMAFYPLSQTVNQLTSVSMKATERTRSYARWSILLSVPDLILAYFLLAPADAAVPGLHLGARGMAIKTALYGLVTSLVYDWLNCQFLGIEFRRALAHKLRAAGVVGGAAVVALGLGAPWLRRMGVPDLAALCAASAVYVAVTGLATLAWPAIAGLTHAQIAHGLRSWRWKLTHTA